MFRFSDFQHTQRSTGSEYPVKLVKGQGQIADVPQRVAHAEEIGRAILKRQGLGAADHQRDSVRYMGMFHHTRTWIYADDQLCIAGNRSRLSSHLTGADTDVHHGHPGTQTTPLQRMASIPGSGTKGHGRHDTLVVPSGSAENAAYPSGPVPLGSVVLLQGRVWCLHGVGGILKVHE